MRNLNNYIKKPRGNSKDFKLMSAEQVLAELNTLKLKQKGKQFDIQIVRNYLYNNDFVIKALRPVYKVKLDNYNILKYLY